MGKRSATFASTYFGGMSSYGRGPLLLECCGSAQRDDVDCREGEVLQTCTE